jgi:CelD/BcsL family acetyltransferase involved in cellulose biosynthesis
MRIEILDELPTELETIARQCPWATFYHTRTWIESLAESFPKWGFRCLAAREGNDFLGYLPYFEMRRGPARALWSLPFGTYGGPVAIDAGEVESRLIASFLDQRRGLGAYEIGLVDFHGRAGRPAVSIESATTHVIDLREGFFTVWEENFERSKRRQTRRAEREGVSVTQASSSGEAKEYYSIYAERSTEWKRRLSYPETLFVRLVTQGGDHVRLFLARSGDTLLGGHLNLYFADTVIAWNGVTTMDSRAAQVSTLLYSSCIRHACENGYKRYNLGASLGKESLTQYKEALGGVPIGYRVLRWRSFSSRMVSAIRTRSPAH